MMKKILLPVLLLFVFSAQGQLNNSWIDYNKTYYKFRLGSDTLCRIPQSVLAAAGIGSADADQFQLWRNGEQVRLFTTSTGGPLAANGYIEFFGTKNDGKPDKKLYRKEDFQLADKFSLETDTASYFLTVNPSGGNLRFVVAVNSSPSALAVEPYFMRKVDKYYNDKINRGFAYPIGEYVYSAAYSEGEGFSSQTVAPGLDLTYVMPGLNVYAAGPPNSLSLRFTACGDAPNERYIRAKLFSDSVYGVPMPFFTYRKAEINNLPLSKMLSPDFLVITLGSASPNIPLLDRFIVSSIGITYPAKFNFNNEKNFYFELPPSAAGNNIVIDNFNYGSIAPILYDQVNGLRYTGDVTSTPGKVKFALPPSTTPVRKFLIASQDVSATDVISTITQKKFLDFSTSAQQADYIIISNPRLYDDGSGNNYVDQYRAYRASVPGGSYNAKVYDIGELTDQFGFGIKNHPAGIRDFLLYANTRFLVKPKYVFLIGRGVDYISERLSENDPALSKIDFVPTFGWPASDVLLASVPGTVGPVIPIGRLGAINGTEISNYLQKMKQYEQAQQTNSPVIADKFWMKDILQVIGGKDSVENARFKNYMTGYKTIVEDTLFGGHVETFSKSTAGVVQENNSQRIEQLINGGLGFIGYFGHSSATVFEFNLSDPSIYNNAGKYPFFNVSGCSAGNFFINDPQRSTGNLTISEKYILTAQKGSIAFLADTHFGVENFLDDYNRNFYNEFSRDMYGASSGSQLQKVIKDLGGLNPDLNYLTRIHLEEIALHGDPAVKINNFPKPDYVIEDALVKISPSIISVADNDFNVTVQMVNKGRATSDSIWVSVKRKLPNDTIRVLYNKLIPGIRSIDSISLSVPISKTTDKGLNQIIVSLDYTNRVSELYETNNTVTKDFYVFEDELKPVYPYNFSIVNKQNLTFIANTANPLSAQRQYTMEIDTTELFNSPFKKSYSTNGIGGIIEFPTTNLNFKDSTVYYWRTAMVPLNNADYIWNGYSFVYLPNSAEGFNQSHYFQHLKNTYDDGLQLSPNRTFKFNSENTTLNVSTGNFPPNDYEFAHIDLGVYQISNWGNNFNTLQFVVLDPLTGSALKNIPVGSSGHYGSNYPGGGRDNQFEFPFNDLIQRKKIMAFIDSMPNSATILVYNLLYNPTVNAYVNSWKADQAILGTGNSLYHKLYNYGFTELDSFYRNIPFIFKFTKNNSNPSFQKVGLTSEEVVVASIPITISRFEGMMTSPLFGPAKSWKEFHWRGFSLEANTADSVRFNVVGVSKTGIETTLYSVDSTIHDLDISSVNAAQYPYIRLTMKTVDSAKGTPYQLRYWRLNYVPIAEGAVAPNILFAMKDTVEQGEDLNFSLAFKNISPTSFDSLMRVKLTIKDRNNVDHVIEIPKRKILMAGDTLLINYQIKTTNYPGLNTFGIDFNPDNDQPEQSHFNNVLYKDFLVKEDKFNPLLDVTFDAVHILNKDIVSSKPNILIKLKDESKFLALKDTSLFKVQVRFPGSNQDLRTYSFGDTMRFTPANLSSGENTATIELKPYFPEDGEYELVVSGKDVNANKSGALDYHVFFNVINKPMISNMLNYPNPFTTSTAFVFTLTGTEVPQNMRIQILTITGKVVREITKDELGPIHIGNNITEFKWDGTDMYGQKLANGVYLYRVLTNLNGKKLDKFDGTRADGSINNNGSVNGTDKFFNKGYGKMYLMR